MSGTRLSLGKRGSLSMWPSPPASGAELDALASPTVVGVASPAQTGHGHHHHESPRQPRLQHGKLKPAKYQEGRASASPHPGGGGQGSGQPSSRGSSYCESRLINPATGEYTFAVKGRSKVLTILTIPYHYVVSLKWWKLICLSALMFAAFNILFAAMYYSPCLLGYSHMGLSVDGKYTKCNYATAFEFSVETIATIGFGEILPGAGWSRGIVMAEAWVSMLVLPCLAAVVFEKVHAVRKLRHTLVFTQSAVVQEMPEGGRVLRFRLASLMKHPPMDVAVNVYLLRDKRVNTHAYLAWSAEEPDICVEELKWRPSYSAEGYADGWQSLPIPYLAMPALIEHPLDAASPLQHMSFESLKASRCEVIAVVRAVDPDSQSAIHIKTAYNSSNVVFNAAFDRDLVTYDPAQHRYDINLTRFDSILPQEGRSSHSPGGSSALLDALLGQTDAVN